METENINNLIRGRRATPPRFFNSKEVSEYNLLNILENAVWAPNHKKTEPWQFIVFRGEDKKKLIEKGIDSLVGMDFKGEFITRETIGKFRQNAERASVVIAITADHGPEGFLPEWEEIAAVSMAVQNMWLTATALGISAFWSTPSYVVLLNTFLGLKTRQKNMGMFFLGYSDIEFPSPGRSPLAEKITWGV